jgi:hypothetical protein
MSYLGDYAAGDIVDFKFTTRRFSTGAPFALTSGAISVYKSNSTTQTTTGVTLTADFDTVTGLNHVRIDTSSDGTFYANGSQFEAIITTGTVDSVSVVGEKIGRFTLRAQASLYPTTAARTLDVSAGGEAGVDWANVGSPTTTVGLTGTTLKLTSTGQAEVADAMLDRDMSTGTDSGSTTVRTVRQALRFLRNKWSISGTTLTVTKEDDATASWTSTVTATAGADPITANDPAGP